jgi:hypothetical protein
VDRARAELKALLVVPVEAAARGQGGPGGPGGPGRGQPPTGSKANKGKGKGKSKSFVPSAKAAAYLAAGVPSRKGSFVVVAK